MDGQAASGSACTASSTRTGNRSRFDWDWRCPSRAFPPRTLSPRSSFCFGTAKTVRAGRQIRGCELFANPLRRNCRIKCWPIFLTRKAVFSSISMCRPSHQTDAIKTIKRKITDLDAMKIQEQKRAVRSGYDMDILSSDLATYGRGRQKLLNKPCRPGMNGCSTLNLSWC